EAFIFNQALMHASYPNQSNQSRLAVTVGVVPEKAKMSMLYYDNDRKKVSRYSMPDDMFLHYPQIIKSPKIGAFEEEFDYVVPEINEQVLKDHLYQNRIKFATMKPLFNDAKNQELFEKNGFLKIPAINEEDIQALLDLLEELNFNRANGHGFYVGMDHKDKKAVSYMMDRVAEIVLPKVAPYLVDYRLITASFVIKDPNPVGIVPPHQDWTFVEDEVQHCSVTCWIPLQKTTMENGCLGVIKGSNQYFSSVRPSPSPQSPSPLSKHMFTLFPYLNLIEMEAGEALIFDNRTIHASPPNISNEPRLAVGLSFTQKEAELRHYYLKPGTKDTLIKYKIDPAFFKKYDNASLSKMYDANQCIDDYEVISEQPFLWDDLSKKQFEERMLASGNQYNKALASHMKKLFGQQMKTGIINKVKSLVRKVIPI
ncbi:MAG: phytanoyl-CoA dioxygenase family protein, partial [Chitinophagales bacterium]